MGGTGGVSYEFGAFRLDVVDKVLYRDGVPVAVTPKAFDTLAVLVECHPRLVTKDELMARVWPGTFVEDNNLAQYISLLRRTLTDGAGVDPVIETVPRRGYRFRPLVRRVEPRQVDEPVAAARIEREPPVPPTSDQGPLPAAPRDRRWGRRLALAATVALVVGTTAAVVWRRAPSPVAMASGDAATTRDPDAYLAYLSGRAAFDQGTSDTANQARARADLERAVARDPGFAPAWALLAKVYGVQYRAAVERDPAILDAAERAARTAVTLDPRLPASHLALAEVFYSRRDHPGMRAALEAGQAVLEGEAAYWHLLTFVAQREGRWSDAEAACRRAFDLDAPGTAEWLAVHFLHLRQYADARRVLAVAQASSRTAAVVPDAWTRFSEHADIAAARQVLEVGLGGRTVPDARVVGLLAQLEWFDGRVERALELVARMDAPGAWLAPNFRFPASIVAGDILQGAGREAEARVRYNEAIATLESRRRADPDDPKLMAALGLAYAGLGRAAEAVQHAERAVALLPRSADAAEGPLYLYLLARVHARLGQVDEATQVLDEMFEAPGFYNDAWVAHDPSFASVRAGAHYAAHVERWAARRGEVLLSPRPGEGRRVAASVGSVVR